MSIHLRRWGAAIVLFGIFAAPQTITKVQADPSSSTIGAAQAPIATATLAQADTNTSSPAASTVSTVKILRLKITAYTSLAAQTDDTPFITADGSYVHDGVVATNLLPFGTKVMIPSLFGDKIFTVDDRMNRKFTNNMDIWMGSEAKALIFGVHIADVVVLTPTSTSPSSNAVAMATETLASLGSIGAGSKLPGPSVRQL